MSTSYRKWLKNKIAKLQAIDCYSAGATPETVAKQIGVSPSKIVKLNFNESMFVDRARQMELVKEVANELDLRLYPEDEVPKFLAKLSSYIGAPENFLVVGNGGDELIDRMVRLFMEKGEAALSFAPTFSIPKLCVKRQEGEYISVPLLSNMQLDVKGMLAKFSDKTRLLYLCSPNNPTSNQFKMKDVETLAKAFPGIVLLDEAYGEFADYSFVPRIREFPNMIILRTFSKAFGLAALRLGYAVANPELAKILTEKTPLPYPVSGFTLRMGGKMLDNIDLMRKSVHELVAERGKLIKSLNQIDGVQAFDSQADFLLVNTEKPADEVNEKLLKRGIMLKKWGGILQYPNCFRVTVGLPEMNAKLVEALKQIQGD
ncbi:MAG: histidinol-phosphate transaminase [Candidatus Bathyarchaeia archaeon]|jgi:histidinol-phosphate aminotransferase